MIILSHRAIDKNNSQPESVVESVENVFRNGFGVELDFIFSKDNKIFFFHDDDFSFLSNSNKKLKFSNLDSSDIYDLKNSSINICDLNVLFKLSNKYNPPAIALHLKGKFQTQFYLNIILNELKKYSFSKNKILIFDLKISSAIFFNKHFSNNIILGVSVSSPSDIKKYNFLTNNTLYTFSKLKQKSNLINCLWLDEWSKNSLITNRHFKIFKKQNFLIGLVTPELHQNTHSKSKNINILHKYFLKIKNLKPDYICTDNPSFFK